MNKKKHLVIHIPVFVGLADTTLQDQLSIDETSTFSHAAPHHHLLAECISPPYYRLPEPLRVLLLPYPGP